MATPSRHRAITPLCHASMPDYQSGIKMRLLLVSLIVAALQCSALLPRPAHRPSLLTLNVQTKELESGARASATYDRDAWSAGFSSAQKEVAGVLPAGTGSVPLDIKGTYFRNGHAKYEVGSDLIMHPFDADGMITAITIQNGEATFRNRMVATDGYRKERRYRKILYRGAFGTKRAGGMFANALDLKTKNVANTNVIYWAGRLLALWEGGLPHKLEPDSLRTDDIYFFKVR